MGKVAQSETCSFAGCERTVSSKGLCKPHYEQQRRGVQLRPLLETLTGICSVDQCTRSIHVKKYQMCRTHYERIIRNRVVELLPRPCEVCDAVFVPRRNAGTRFCSNECSITSARWRRDYGIGGLEVREMLCAQDGKCSICGDRIDDGTFHIDHNHQTGAVRALLCGQCNRGIGHFRDDPDLTQAATEYLRRFATPPANTFAF